MAAGSVPFRPPTAFAQAFPRGEPMWCKPLWTRMIHVAAAAKLARDNGEGNLFAAAPLQQ
jgi:hypothetical protein